MNITIEIDCETIQELGQHLSALRDQITSKARRNKLDIYKDEFTNGKGLSDNNCYGTHKVKITND